MRTFLMSLVLVLVASTAFGQWCSGGCGGATYSSAYYEDCGSCYSVGPTYSYSCGPTYYVVPRAYTCRTRAVVRSSCGCTPTDSQSQPQPQNVPAAAQPQAEVPSPNLGPTRAQPSQPNEGGTSPLPPPVKAEAPTPKMTIILRCPADSQVWVNNHLTTSTGTKREYVSYANDDMLRDYYLVVKTGNDVYKGKVTLAVGETNSISVSQMDRYSTASQYAAR